MKIKIMKAKRIKLRRKMKRKRIKLRRKMTKNPQQ